MYVGLRQLRTIGTIRVCECLFCLQLMKANVAKTSCSQLSLTESAMYVYAQDQFASYLQCSNESSRYHSLSLSVGCVQSAWLSWQGPGSREGSIWTRNRDAHLVGEC